MMSKYIYLTNAALALHGIAASNVYSDEAAVIDKADQCSFTHKYGAIQFQCNLVMITFVFCICATIFDGKSHFKRAFTAAFLMLLSVHYVRFWQDAITILNFKDGADCGSERALNGFFARLLVNLVFYGQLIYFTASSLALIVMVLLTIIKRHFLRGQS